MTKAKMPSCSAINCVNRTGGSESRLFCFPLGDKERLAQWVHKVRRECWVPSKNSRLCAVHFEEECFFIKGGKKHLRPTAIPTIFDFSLKSECILAEISTPTVKGKDHTHALRDHEDKTMFDSTSDSEMSYAAAHNEPRPPVIIHTTQTSTEHNYAVIGSPKSVKRQMETQINSVEEKLDHCRKQLKMEQQRSRRLHRRVISLSKVVKELKKKKPDFHRMR